MSHADTDAAGGATCLTTYAVGSRSKRAVTSPGSYGQ